MASDEIVETTLGELIAALTEETDRLVGDKSESNILVAYILSDLLHQSTPESRRWH